MIYNDEIKGYFYEGIKKCKKKSSSWLTCVNLTREMKNKAYEDINLNFNNKIWLYPLDAFFLCFRYPKIFNNLNGNIDDKVVHQIYRSSIYDIDLTDRIGKWSNSEMSAYTYIMKTYGIDCSKLINMHVYNKNQIEILSTCKEEYFKIINKPHSSFKAGEMKKIIELLDLGYDYIDYQNCNGSYVVHIHKLVTDLINENQYYNFDTIKYIFNERLALKGMYPSEEYLNTVLISINKYNQDIDELIKLEAYQIKNIHKIIDAVNTNKDPQTVKDCINNIILDDVGYRYGKIQNNVLQSIIKYDKEIEWYEENHSILDNPLILDKIEINIKNSFPTYKRFPDIVSLIARIKKYYDFLDDNSYNISVEKKIRKQETERENRKKELPQAIEMVKRFIDYKYTSTKVYLRECGIEEKDFKRALKTLEMFSNPIHDTYIDITTNNRNMNFNKIKANINNVIDSIEGNPNYSLFDYCMECKIPLDKINEMVNNPNIGIPYNRRRIINQFHNRNIKKAIYISNDSIYNSEWIIKGYTVTKEDKDEIVKYMVKNSIPFYVSVYKQVGRMLLKDKIEEFNN